MSNTDRQSKPYRNVQPVFSIDDDEDEDGGTVTAKHCMDPITLLALSVTKGTTPQAVKWPNATL